MMKLNVVLATGLAVMLSAVATVAGDGAEFTADFRLHECAFSASGRNTYFNLNPGHRLVLEGENLVVQITVLRAKKKITFRENGERITVRCRVIEEREWVDGELVEVSRNFFARCKRTGNVYYFGENVDNYEDGEIVDHEGSWRAGRNGAKPGLIMPSVFLLGAKYMQEIAEEDEALDRARHAEMGITFETPAGTFENCIKIVETSEVEPGEKSIKIYAPNVGMIFDDGIKLVDF